MKNIITTLSKMSIKTAIIPIHCLTLLNIDIEQFKKNHNLGKLQNWVMDNYISDTKGISFKVKSLVLTAVKQNLVKVIFNYKGKQVSSILNIWPSQLKQDTINVFSNNNFNIEYAYWLPAKRLAVCAGLAEYGRNNVTYVKGWGSLIEHASFFSDIEPPEDYTWRKVKMMDYCKGCLKCIEECPTKAINKNQFLINPELCISNYNEMGKEPLPSFIKKESCQSIVDCFYCQQSCPHNKKMFNKISKEIFFSNEETEILLKGTPVVELPKELKEKVTSLKMEWFYESIPRNLEALLNNCN